MSAKLVYEQDARRRWQISGNKSQADARRHWAQDKPRKPVKKKRAFVSSAAFQIAYLIDNYDVIAEIVGQARLHNTESSFEKLNDSDFGAQNFNIFTSHTKS